MGFRHTVRGASVALTAGILLLGCRSSLSYLPPAENRPALILATGYTQAGCVERLQAEARKRNVTIKVTKVIRQVGAGPFLFPFYRDYLCHGEVTGGAEGTR
jgi:hypothetical protein